MGIKFANNKPVFTVGGSDGGGGGGGSGTVTSVSVTTANGVSGTVATDTTTPAITLALGAITPSSVAAVGTVTGSNLSGTNTGNQTITLTGDVAGSGTGSFATTLATVAINKGGTGQTSAANAINALVPTQTSNNGKYLQTDGSVVSWATAGGASIGTGAYSALPAAGTAGNLYLPNDSPIILRDSGAAWAPFGPIFGPLNPPIADFTTWVNQGARGSVTTNGTLCMFDAGPSTNQENLICRVKAVPVTTPWNFTLAFLPSTQPGGSCNMGIMLRDSSSGHIKAQSIVSNDSTLYVFNWASATVFNNNPANGAWINRPSLIMFQIRNDGTNLSFRTSADMINWNEWYSEAVSGNYLANIDQAGFYINSSGIRAAGPTYMNVLHCAFS